MSWRDYASAPVPGTAVCDLTQIRTVRAITLTTSNGDFPLLLVQTGEGLRAYVNACPHQYLPLDYRGTQLVSEDGSMLMCTAHGAQFDINSGTVIRGADCGLDPVPIEIIDGKIYIAAVTTEDTA